MKLNLYNEAKQYQVEKEKITIVPPANCDMIVSPKTFKKTVNAPFLWMEAKNDFVIRAKVSHAFASLYDAACLIAYERDDLWAKVCFECSDKNVKSVVSVMSNGVSDDANGPDVQADAIWLQMLRKNNTIAVHYSFDGIEYHFLRILSLPFSNVIKLGFLAQSPMGKGGAFLFENYEINMQSVQDERKGK